MSRKYLDIFLREAEEQLASLQQGLLVLEKQPDNTPLIHELMRNAHTVKGSAKMLGMEDISAIAHAMEDRFREFENGVRAVDGGYIDRLLQGCDAISRITYAIVRNEESPINVDQFLEAFNNNELAAQNFQTQRPESTAIGDTVRTKVSTLDSIIHLVGELFICRQRLEDRTEFIRLLGQETADPKLQMKLKSFGFELEEDVQHMDILIQHLREESLSLRMLPLKTITEDFKLKVRELGRSMGKDVALVVHGEQMELDRALIEEIKPFLLHIINNAVAHGIETPAERASAGKPTVGTIHIDAAHEGDIARISIRDDGRGMDPQLIKKRAVQQGIIKQTSADKLTDEEAIYLTLHHGFSTTEIVNDITGRGVGLDVVNKGIEQIRGGLQLSSKPGEFCRITLLLPLTLSIIQALMVSCSDDTFAIPTAYVEEVVKLRPTDILEENGLEGIMLRGSFVRLISLRDIFELSDNPIFIDKDKITAVILKQKGDNLACAVDFCHGDSEIVVKNIGSQLQSADYIIGATILGNGNTALILNVHDIFDSSRTKAETGIRERLQELLNMPHKGTILAVDDSITSRTIIRSILTTNGYLVESAESGEEALRKLSEMPFDMMIADIEMPGMNGYELTEKVRSNTAYRDLPIIVISSLNREEDWRKAMDIGAQAYMIKGDFNQELLLELIQALLKNNAAQKDFSTDENLSKKVNEPDTDNWRY